VGAAEHARLASHIFFADAGATRRGSLLSFDVERGRRSTRSFGYWRSFQPCCFLGGANAASGAATTTTTTIATIEPIPFLQRHSR